MPGIDPIKPENNYSSSFEPSKTNENPVTSLTGSYFSLFKASVGKAFHAIASLKNDIPATVEAPLLPNRTAPKDEDIYYYNNQPIYENLEHDSGYVDIATIDQKRGENKFIKICQEVETPTYLKKLRCRPVGFLTVDLRPSDAKKILELAVKNEDIEPGFIVNIQDPETFITTTYKKELVNHRLAFIAETPTVERQPNPLYEEVHREKEKLTKNINQVRQLISSLQQFKTKEESKFDFFARWIQYPLGLTEVNRLESDIERLKRVLQRFEANLRDKNL